MPTISQGPPIQKGALLVIDPVRGGRRTIVFQYNPEKLTRTLTPQVSGGDTDQRSQGLRYTAAAQEAITLEVSIDAVDQLEAGRGPALAQGIHPQLATLELLLYPPSSRVQETTNLLSFGTIEVTPYAVPLTLLVWGKNRTLPVRLTSYSVVEEFFDGSLNPIQATVSLGLRAITYSDVDPSHPAYTYFLAYQQNRERMAGQGPSALSSLVNFAFSLFR
jgi:hypothetical protein